MTKSDESKPIQLHIAVGSTNPVKINAVKLAFQQTFSSQTNSNSNSNGIQIVTSSYNVSSGVPDQPMGDIETKLGAKNRAEAAYKQALQESSHPNNNHHHNYGPPDFSVGLEGGCEESDGILWCMAWMAILGSDSPRCKLCQVDPSNSNLFNSSNIPKSFDSKTPQKFWSFGRTGSFPLPPKVTALVQSGMELGDADDAVFQRINSKQGSGTVGILTKGMIDRTSYYDHALKLALVPWIHPALYLDVEEEH